MKMTLQNRCQKYSSVPLNKFSNLAPYFFLTLRPCTARQAWKFIFTIIKDFFLLQHLQKLHITKRPVVNVDTEIDEKIPFTPSYVTTYLGFVEFFIRPMDMLKKRLGYRKAASYLCLYLKFLTHIYSHASAIYRFCMTTTTRPRFYKNRKFRTIHFFDPHLLCVPSIHVAISAGSYAWFSQLFKTGILPQEEAEMRLNEIKKQAIAIVESVVFIKQHSVNCIPLALYMLSSTMYKSFFTVQDSINFIDDLFLETPEISPEVRQEIIDHFYYLYERTLLESKYSANWEECIQHWLMDFAAETGQQQKFL